MPMSKYLRTILVIVLLFILGVICWFVFFQDDPEDNVEQQDQDASAQVETQEEESPEVSATLEAIPETSPTENTNPFEGTYKNPFE